MRKKTSLTRTLMAACSVFALTAVMYGCVHSGSDAPDEPVVEQPDPDVEAKALADAQAAARAAWQDARVALASIAGVTVNPAAAQLAANALDDAAAANTAAQAATTSADAEKHQDAAEAARDMAVQHVATVIASRDAGAIGTAQMAASSAADAAKLAYDAAVAALADVEAIKDIDQESYDKAAAQVAAAKTAYDAAVAASTAAAAAELLADAQAQQKAAETALQNANTANTNAMKYAGMVQSAEDIALASVKSGAQSIYDTAKAAYDTAAARVAALNKQADPDNHVRASDALARAKTALDAAAAANEKAQDAETSSAAAPHHSDVEDAAVDVTAELGGVAKYAAMVEAEQDDIADEEQRVMDVAAARTAAMGSYTDADNDATKAEKAADEAEATAPGSAGAIDAREFAKLARTAANDAKAAHDAITDGMTKDEADAKAQEAADEAFSANLLYLEAKRENNAIQTAAQIGEQQQEARDLAAAQEAASGAADEAQSLRDQIAALKGQIDERAAAAKKSAEKAKLARTNYAGDPSSEETKGAREHASDANGIAEAAAWLLGEADKELTKANNANTAAQGAETSDDAETAQDDAEAAVAALKLLLNGDETDPEGDDYYATRKGATGMASDAMYVARDAETDANTHVLGLLKMANTVGIMDNPVTANVDEKQLHQTAVNAEIAEQAVDADNAAIATTVAPYVDTGGDGPGANDTGTRWPYDGDFANDPGGEGEGLLTIQVNLDTAEYTTTRDNPATTTIDETNFTKERGLDGFPEAVEISVDDLRGGTAGVFDATDTKTRILVFTDKEQATAGTPARTESVTRVNAVASRINLADAATDLTDTGTTYDHDDDPDTAAATGTFACATDATCTLNISGGKVTAISGYTFTGSATIAAVASMEDQTYLAFGVWMQETNAENDTNGYQFGAFADGGSEYVSTNAPVAAIVGTATYNGSAAGVRSTASAVDWFEGDATLTANFGKPGTAADPTAADDEMGYITGKIHNIVAGGVSMGDAAIYLDAVDDTTDDPSSPASIGVQSISDTGTFDGTARMGVATTDPVTGAVTYPFTGTWQGTFYNQVAEDTDTAALEATMPPMSAAGTFGVTHFDDMDTTDTDDDVRESFVGAFGAHRDE